MSDRIDLDDLTSFTAGAVGEPGSRVFYLQARTAAVTVSVKCEKGQVDALAQYLARFMEDLPSTERAQHPSLDQLVEPIISLWILGAIGVAYDADDDRIVLQLEEAVLVDEDDEFINEAEHGVLRLRLTRAQVLAFVTRARSVVSAGRPPCEWCGGPVNTVGHDCPRMN